MAHPSAILRGNAECPFGSLIIFQFPLVTIMVGIPVIWQPLWQDLTRGDKILALCNGRAPDTDDPFPTESITCHSVNSTVVGDQGHAVLGKELPYGV